MDYCLNCKDCIESLVERYGEIHVFVEDHESVAGSEPIGLRSGPSYYYNDMGVKVEADDQDHFLPYDRIIKVEEAVGWPD